MAAAFWFWDYCTYQCSWSVAIKDMVLWVQGDCISEMLESVFKVAAREGGIALCLQRWVDRSVMLVIVWSMGGMLLGEAPSDTNLEFITGCHLVVDQPSCKVQMMSECYSKCGNAIIIPAGLFGFFSRRLAFKKLEMHNLRWRPNNPKQYIYNSSLEIMLNQYTKWSSVQADSAQI